MNATAPITTNRDARFGKNIFTPLSFSFQENSPRNREPAVDRVVFKGWMVLDLVIEAQPGTIADRKKITKIERADILTRHRVSIELVVARIDILRLPDAVAQ